VLAGLTGSAGKKNQPQQQDKGKLASKRCLYFEELNGMTILLTNQPFNSRYVGSFNDANNNCISASPPKQLFIWPNTMFFHNSKKLIYYFTLMKNHEKSLTPVCLQ